VAPVIPIAADPLTLSLTLANTIAEVYKLQLESMDPVTRAEFVRLQFEDMKEWRAEIKAFRDFFANLKLPAIG
jgi:hypothetical protein